MMMKFIKDSDERQKSLDQILENQDATLQNHGASIHNLEVQVGQLAKMLSKRPQSALPSNTKLNPREQVNAITLRSETELKFKPKKGIEQKQSPNSMKEKL